MPFEGPQAAGDTFFRKVVAPVSLLVAAMIVVAIAAAIWVAQHQTTDMTGRERSLAETAIATRAGALEKTTNDYALWDDSFENLVRRQDRSWFETNVARPATDEFGLPLAAVVGPGGEALLGKYNAADLPQPLAAFLAGGFRTLVERVASEGGPATTSGLLLLDGAPAIVVASRIRPYTETVAPGAFAPRFLVLADRLGDAELAALSKAYLLPDLHVARRVADDAAIRLQTVDGRNDITLAWRGSDPGGELLLGLLPIMIGLLIVFGGLMANVLREGRAATIRLGESERRALLDPLTGLPNRLALFARVEGMVAAEKDPGFALAYLDLDGFKQVNDQHGHDVGDEVLREAARRMAAALRENDLLVRLGGDEFAILLPGLTDAPSVRRIAERVIAGVSEPFEANGVTVSVGASVGVAVSPTDARDTLELVKIADAALYRVKRSGKGTVLFSLSA